MTPFLTNSELKTYTIKRGDPNFIIQGTFTVANRAGFEIGANCPAQYKSIIVECYNRGWLNPVANVTEREMIFMGLANG
jgi:hypothetical protein